MCHFISETMFCNHCFAALGGEQRAKWKDDICSGNKASVLPAQHVCEDVRPLPGLLHEKFNFSPQWICYAQDPNGTTIHFQGPSLKSDLASRQKYSNRDFIRSHVSLLLITYTMLHFICIFFFQTLWSRNAPHADDTVDTSSHGGCCSTSTSSQLLSRVSTSSSN